MHIMLKIAAAVFALVLVMIGIAAAAHAYDLLRQIYGPNLRIADLAFVVGAALLCFYGAHRCLTRIVFRQATGRQTGRHADARDNATDAD